MTRNEIKEIINLLKTIEKAVVEKEDSIASEDIVCRDKLGNKIIVGDYVHQTNATCNGEKKILEIYKENNEVFLKVLDVISDNMTSYIEPHNVIKKDEYHQLVACMILEAELNYLCSEYKFKVISKKNSIVVIYDCDENTNNMSFKLDILEIAKHNLTEKEIEKLIIQKR